MKWAALVVLYATLYLAGLSGLTTLGAEKLETKMKNVRESGLGMEEDGFYFDEPIKDSGTKCYSCWDVSTSGKGEPSHLSHYWKALVDKFLALKGNARRCSESGALDKASYQICTQGCSTVSVNDIDVEIRWDNGTVRKSHLDHFNARGCLEALPRRVIHFDPQVTGCFSMESGFYRRNELQSRQRHVNVKWGAHGVSACACHKDWCNSQAFKAGHTKVSKFHPPSMKASLKWFKKMWNRIIH